MKNKFFYYGAVIMIGGCVLFTVFAVVSVTVNTIWRMI